MEPLVRRWGMTTNDGCSRGPWAGTLANGWWTIPTVVLLALALTSCAVPPTNAPSIAGRGSGDELDAVRERLLYPTGQPKQSRY